MNTAIPLQERKSPLRGLLDLATGRYPRFLFGGGLGAWLPVFHFHGAHPEALEPYLRFLAENGYRTVTSDAIAGLVLRGVHPGPRSVALCFDDAWSSLWVVAAPLLAQYGFRAIAYVSPARVPGDASPRPRHPGGSLPPDLAAIDRTDPMFCTWSELQSLETSGTVDIQAHSWRHAKVFASPEATGFIRPGHRAQPHAMPLIETTEGLRFAARDDLGAPLYPARSRLSDALRWIAPQAQAACLQRVRENGGAAFFDRPEWEAELRACVRQAPRGRWETPVERDAAIAEELGRSREILEHRLGKKVRHLCFPWAVAGRTAVQAAPTAGFETAFADRLGGARAVRAGDPPFQLMRLKHPLIFCLPGKGRRWFFGRRTAPADRGLDAAPPLLPASGAIP